MTQVKDTCSNKIYRLTATVSPSGSIVLLDQAHQIHHAEETFLLIEMSPDTSNGPTWRLPTSRIDGKDPSTLSLYTVDGNISHLPEDFRTESISHIPVPGRFIFGVSAWASSAHLHAQHARLLALVEHWVAEQAAFFVQVSAEVARAKARHAPRPSSHPSPDKPRYADPSADKKAGSDLKRATGRANDWLSKPI